MRERRLGSTDLRVSEIGFGAWAIGGNRHGNSYGPTDDEVSLAAVERALELGCTFFDTADVYGWGHSESLLGQALEGRREEVVLATKVGGDFYHGGVQMNFGAAYIPFALERSLQRLRTDHVDLYQLHNPPLELLRDEALFDVLDSLQAEGRVHHVGVSVHRPEEAEAVAEAGRPETVQLPFSLYRQEWIESAFPLLEEASLGIVSREPLGNGFLTGKYDEGATFPPGDIRSRWPPGMVAARVRAAREVARTLSHREESLAQLALKFCLAFPVSTVIAGAKTPRHVEQNLGAAEGDPLTTEEVEALQALYRENFRL